MENENQCMTETAEDLVQAYPLLEDLMAPPEPRPAPEKPPESPEKPDPVPALQQDLENALQRVRQLERERWLLSQGVPEEDLDYYAFKIGSLVTSDKDFAAAAKDYLRDHRLRPGGISTAAALSGRISKAPGINETMNRLIRGE